VKSSSGQVLIIAVMVLLMLLIAIPAVIFLNESATSHSVNVQKKIKGRAMAEEGVSYAIQQMSLNSPNNWPPLGGACPANFNGATLFPSSQGSGYFTLQCIPGPTTDVLNNSILGYQVVIYSVPRDASNFVVAGSSLEAVLSQMTVGAKLSTGLNVSAALQLTYYVPILQPNSDLRVDWGPVVSFDTTNTFTLSYSMDNNQSPRKFIAGLMSSCQPPHSGCPSTINRPNQTDRKEYWTSTALGFPPVIDTHTANGYLALSQAESALPTAVCHDTSGGNPDSTLSPNGGYYDTSTCLPAGNTWEALFDSPGDWAWKSNSDIIYVHGDAEFRNVAIDLWNKGAVIVTGNMTIGARQDNSGNIINSEPVPPSANLEYYYNPGSMPCPGSQGQSCSQVSWQTGNARPSIRGFVYVGGNMGVNPHSPGTGTTTVIVGTLRVDGQLTIQPNATLRLFYDDVINHNILTENLELKADTLSAVP
jgi:hypothetical protein